MWFLRFSDPDESSPLALWRLEDIVEQVRHVVVAQEKIPMTHESWQLKLWEYLSFSFRLVEHSCNRILWHYGITCKLRCSISCTHLLRSMEVFAQTKNSVIPYPNN